MGASVSSKREKKKNSSMGVVTTESQEKIGDPDVCRQESQMGKDPKITNKPRERRSSALHAEFITTKTRREISREIGGRERFQKKAYITRPKQGGGRRTPHAKPRSTSPDRQSLPLVKWDRNERKGEKIKKTRKSKLACISP